MTSYPTPSEIRAARTARGLTQRQAAETVLYTERAWQDWEAGLRRMHPAIWGLFLHGGVDNP